MPAPVSPVSAGEARTELQVERFDQDDVANGERGEHRRLPRRSPGRAEARCRAYPVGGAPARSIGPVNRQLVAVGIAEVKPATTGEGEDRARHRPARLLDFGQRRLEVRDLDRD